LPNPFLSFEGIVKNNLPQVRHAVSIIKKVFVFQVNIGYYFLLIAAPSQPHQQSRAELPGISALPSPNVLSWPAGMVVYAGYTATGTSDIMPCSPTNSIFQGADTMPLSADT
jgi:hypothetical protein